MKTNPCTVPKKEVLARLKDRFPKNKLKIVGDYKNLTTRTDFICDSGHVFSHKPSKLLEQKHGCVICYNGKPRKKVVRSSKSIKERFEALYVKKKKCWEWIGAKQKTSNKYGSFFWKEASNSAHRASYMIYKGPIPKGLHVCHKCDNPICVNPSHLFLGTNYDNVQDRVSKNRTVARCGEANGFNKLNEETAKYIIVVGCQAKADGKRYLNYLVDKLGYSKTTICDIANRKTWKQLDGFYDEVRGLSSNKRKRLIQKLEPYIDGRAD